MKKEQVDHYRMLHAVQSHFDSNPAIWSSNIPVSDVKTALSTKLEQIAEAALLQSTDSTGVTIDKARLRTDLEAKGFFVCSVLRAYANLNPSYNLLSKKLQITKAGFARFRENDLLVAIDDLDAAAASVIESLAPFGVTQTTLDELMAARAAFHNIMNRPDEVTVNRKSATNLIAQLLGEGLALLEDKMDHLMVIFSETEPQFRNVYFYDRAIHRTGKRKLSLLITTLDADGSSPLAKANIEVVGHGIKRISNKSGLNRVQNLKEGHYTMTVSHPDFISQTIPFSIVHHQTTEVFVELEKEGSKVQRSKVAEKPSDSEPLNL